MSDPKVAVVILNWNGKKYLNKFLPSVLQTRYPHTDFYLADNASTDDSVAFVKENFPRLKIIQNSGNLGFAGGYNEALSKIEAEYYVLLNQDVSVTPNWLDPLVELMEKEPETGACQPKIRSQRHPEYFEYAGGAGGWIDRYGFTFCRGRLFEIMEKDQGQYNDVQSVFWASGAALFIRSTLYHKAGGLDVNFFAHMEEIDLCWRLQRMGHKIKVCPQSVIYHVGGGSLSYGNPQKTFLNFRNNLLLLYKNLKPSERGLKLFCRKVLDGIAAIRGLLTGNRQEFISIWDAHKSFRKWKKENKQQLDAIDRPAFFSFPGVYRGSIAWQFFIKKRKRFRDLPKMKK